MSIRTALAIVASLVFSAAAAAQTKAETKRVSDRLVTFRVTLPDATSAQLTVPEGELARVAQTGGATLGISAYIQDETEGVVLFKVFEIKTRPSGNESIRQIEALRHELGHPPSVTTSTPAIELAVLRIKSKTQASAAPPQPEWAAKCCVTCARPGVEAPPPPAVVPWCWTAAIAVRVSAAEPHVALTRRTGRPGGA